MFKQKKGISGHIDWIIGIAMFLLAIGSMIVLFKPGITPTTSADTMLNIVQDSFISDTEWTITKQPIFIAPIKYIQQNTDGNSIAGPETGIKNIEFIDTSIIIDTGSQDTTNSLPKKLNELDLLKINLEMFYIPTNEYGTIPNEMDASQNENSDARTALTEMSYNYNEREYGIKFDYTTPDIIKIKTQLSPDISSNQNMNKKTKHLLLYTKNSEQINFETGPTTYPTEIKACYAKGDITIYDPNMAQVTSTGDGCKAIYQLGVAEEISGISIQKFNELNEQTGTGCRMGYECIKQKWNFPATNNFKIKISLPNTPQNSISFPESIIQPENARIYARTITGQILTDDAEPVPVSIIIQVW